MSRALEHGGSLPFLSGFRGPRNPAPSEPSSFLVQSHSVLGVPSTTRMTVAGRRSGPGQDEGFLWKPTGEVVCDVGNPFPSEKQHCVLNSGRMRDMLCVIPVTCQCACSLVS